MSQNFAQNKTLRLGGFFGYSGLFPSVIPLLHHHIHIVSPFWQGVNFFIERYTSYLTIVCYTQYCVIKRYTWKKIRF